MGQTLVIVHDIRLAFELLEKRSVKYSSRPKQVFAGEMCVQQSTSYHILISNVRLIRFIFSPDIG